MDIPSGFWEWGLTLLLIRWEGTIATGPGLSSLSAIIRLCNALWICCFSGRPLWIWGTIPSTIDVLCINLLFQIVNVLKVVTFTCTKEIRAGTLIFAHVCYTRVFWVNYLVQIISNICHSKIGFLGTGNRGFSNYSLCLFQWHECGK